MRRLGLPLAFLCLLASHASAMQIAPVTHAPIGAAARTTPDPLDPHDVAPRDLSESNGPLRDGAPVFEATRDAATAPPDVATRFSVMSPEIAPAKTSGANALISFTLAALLLSVTLYVLLVASRRRRYVLYLAPILATSTASLLLLVAIFGNPLTGIGISGGSATEGSAMGAGPAFPHAVSTAPPRSASSMDDPSRNDPGHTDFQVVPEPSSASLLGCGLGALARSRRRPTR